MKNNNSAVKSRKALKIGLWVGLILGLLRGLPILAKSGVSDPEKFGEVIGYALGASVLGMIIGMVVDWRRNKLAS